MHIFHMDAEPNHKVQGLWLLLLRTASVHKKTAVWFVVNGVPIRYSLREHALLCGFYCHEYPNGISPHMNLSDYKSELKETLFGNQVAVNMNDVEERLLKMKRSSENRLKLTILFFLSSVLACKSKSDGNIAPFLFKMAEDPQLCMSYPWGRMTYESTVTDIYYTVASMHGSPKKKFCFPGFCIPLEVSNLSSDCSFSKLPSSSGTNEYNHLCRFWLMKVYQD